MLTGVAAKKLPDSTCAATAAGITPVKVNVIVFISELSVEMRAELHPEQIAALTKKEVREKNLHIVISTSK